MAKIKLTAGVFCWQRDIIRAGDPAFEVDDAAARRLVEKGVAEYVTPPATADDDAAGDIARAQAEKSIDEMTKDELRELGAQYGLTFGANAKKSEMIDAITAEWPVPADEDAPTFDAAEAVQ